MPNDNTTTRRSDAEIDADIKVCRLDNVDGDLVGYVRMRRDQIPAAFRYEGRIYLQGYKRTFTEMAVLDIAAVETPA